MRKLMMLLTLAVALFRNVTGVASAHRCAHLRR